MVRIVHIILAAFVLLSSIGLVVNKHFCQGELKTTSLFTEPASCHDDPAKPVCKFHQHLKAEQQTDCCTNESAYHKADLQKQVDVATSQLTVTPVTQLVAPKLTLFPLPEKKAQRYLTYKPPIVDRDISVLFQSFLL